MTTKTQKNTLNTKNTSVKAIVQKTAQQPAGSISIAKLASQKISKTTVNQRTTTSKGQTSPPIAKQPAVNQTLKEQNPSKRAVYASEGKRRVAISQKNLSQELQDVMKERFPRGYADYMDKIIKVDKPDGSFFYAITLEVEDAIYLVKIDVQIDTDYEEVEKKLFGGGHEVDDEGNELPDSEDDEKDFIDDNVADEE
jgi:hypothetical protein